MEFLDASYLAPCMVTHYVLCHMYLLMFLIHSTNYWRKTINVNVAYYLNPAHIVGIIKHLNFNFKGFITYFQKCIFGEWFKSFHSRT